MRSSRKAVLVISALAAVAAHAEFGRWVEHLDIAAKLEAVFFKDVKLPTGIVKSRRPPSETTAELTRAIAAQPGRADLLYLRARERELNLDFTGAEADWKAYATAGTPRMQARMALADYYSRRLEPDKEIAALIEAGRLPTEDLGKAVPPPEQASWKALQRAVDLISAQALPASTAAAVYNTWIDRYTQDAQVFEKAFEFYTGARDWSTAEGILDRYSRVFPNEKVFPIRARATLAARRGTASEALAVYEQAWDPLWPPDLVKSYFDLMERTHALRAWLADTRNAIAARPTELGPAARLFYYHQQRGDLAQAWRALQELRIRKQMAQSSWSAADLMTIARLYKGTNSVVEAARYYVQAYDTDRTASAAAEEALSGLANLLLAAADQPIPYGTGDLTYYRDIATMDRSPGVLNGILSLILNTTWPQSEFAQEQSAAIGYFHRARAAELVAEFNTRFPSSTRRPALNALVIEAYAKHADDDGVIRRGSEYLAAFPKAPERIRVALAMTDAYARLGQTEREFALYDSLLKELAVDASGYPVGRVSSPAPPVYDENAPAQPSPPQQWRSPEYVQVLDRYLGRLVSMKRLTDALTVYRREIDRNPNDPALYERLAQFLMQNRLDARVAEVYSRAARQFVNDPSWYGKLARWHLQRKQTAAFANVAQEVVKVFAGSDLETFFAEVVSAQPLGPAMYVQLNRFAHERFPHDLMFVRNLLNAYEIGPTANPAAYEQLLRDNWYTDEELRRRFFSFLSRTNRLEAELKALAGLPDADRNDRAAEQFVAEARAWQGHFEEAAGPLQHVSSAYPGETELASRTSSLYRSLNDVPKAIAAVDRMIRYAPRDDAAIIRTGEIYADREQFGRARTYWDRISQIQPGRPDGYLEAATVYWDYYRYDDALRVIGDARKRLGSSPLFAYEAGAIREGKREWKEAISEYVAGALDSLESPARRRLMTLATRPAMRPVVEDAVVRATSGASPSAAALALRVAMFEEQQRRADLRQYLQALIPSTASPELLGQIAAVAERQGLDDTRAAVTRREIAISKDPVERTRLRLSMVRFYEAHNNVGAATTEMDALYKDNPATLGVVRATVDFAWRNKRAVQAIDMLTASAMRANVTYRRQFLVEAGRKANEAGEYVQARRIIEPLLAAEPTAADLIALEADSYARAGDDATLRTFYAAKLKEIRDPAARLGLRRTLIPVLTRLKDYAGGIDQYIEILNQYPDDRALIGEAATYARNRSQHDRLMAYYTKASAASPKDARWPILMARLSAEFEDLPGAVAAYARASAVRPERQDLVMERAGLEERLRQWDAAATSYTRLYELAYHDPQWMAKVAEQRARQGRRADAVQALRTAFVDGRPARAGDYFETARLLESWDMLAEAADFAERGIRMISSSDSDFERNVDIYMRVAMRRRDYARAYGNLTLDEPGASRVWRAAAPVAATYYTPEEKAAFAAYLSTTAPHDSQIALAAGLMDLAAQWMTQARRTRDLITLEQSRMRFAQAAAALERLAKTTDGNEASQAYRLLSEAAENYRLAGQTQNELRVLGDLERSGGLGGPSLARYGELLRTAAPDRLLELARSGSLDKRNSAAQAALAGTDADLALRVIAARSTRMPPVWNCAYVALTGLYFGRTTPDISAAFAGALGPRTVGEQVAHAADRTQQLAGDDWFYYGARYGEYLAVAHQAGAEDFVVAEVEGRPASAVTYLALADSYRTVANGRRAIAEYEHALELEPGRADAHSRMAEVYIAEGKKAQALSEWHAAIAALSAMQDARRVPEEFWAELAEVSMATSRAGVTHELRPDVEKLIGTYVHRNGLYRIEEVLAPVLASDVDVTAEVLELARSAKDPIEFLSGIVDQECFPAPAREGIYARLVELAEADVAAQFGDARRGAESRVRDYRMRQAQALLSDRRYKDAWRVIETFTDVDRRELTGSLPGVELWAAAGLGGIDVVLRRYETNREAAPATATLLEAATSLRREGHAVAARRVLEYVYERALGDREFTAANFLGLAEVKLQSGDTAGAVAVLRRLMIVGQDAFDALTPAAELLERFGKTTEAREFWTARASVAPWDATAAVAVADQTALRRLAASSETPYAARVRAARLLPGEAALGSAELDLLAGGNASPAAAEKPYFYYARVRAAETTKDAAVRLRLLRGALEIDPSVTSTRVAVFQAAVAAKRPAATVGAVRGMAGDDFERAEPPKSVYSYQAENFLRSLNLEDTQRARMAMDLAAANRRLGRLPSAVYLLRIAERLDPTLKVGPDIDSITAELEEAKQNRERMPVVSDTTAQPNRVRPRVSSKSQGGRV